MGLARVSAAAIGAATAKEEWCPVPFGLIAHVLTGQVGFPLRLVPFWPRLTQVAVADRRSRARASDLEVNSRSCVGP
jgi:hypothetical protein